MFVSVFIAYTEPTASCFMAIAVPITTHETVSDIQDSRNDTQNSMVGVVSSASESQKRLMSSCFCVSPFGEDNADNW